MVIAELNEQIQVFQQANGNRLLENSRLLVEQLNGEISRLKTEKDDYLKQGSKREEEQTRKLDEVVHYYDALQVDFQEKQNVILELTRQITHLRDDMQDASRQYSKNLNEVNSKLDETIKYYESLISAQAEEQRQTEEKLIAHQVSLTRHVDGESIEIIEYQQKIKEQSLRIQCLENEINNCQVKFLFYSYYFELEKKSPLFAYLQSMKFRI